MHEHGWESNNNQRGMFALTITLQKTTPLKNMSAFSIMPSNAYWQIVPICIDIYVFAMITSDWLEKTESMIEMEIHYQQKQLN